MQVTSDLGFDFSAVTAALPQITSGWLQLQQLKNQTAMMRAQQEAQMRALQMQTMPTAPNALYVQTSRPPWLIPAAVVGGGLLLFLAARR